MPGNDRSERANGALALPQLELDRRERADAARNREAILCAAQRLVSERGVDGVTMDEVACAAGVGKGTLFRRFGDRNGLLRALLDERERAFQESFIRGPAPLGPGAGPCERLVAYGERRLEEVEIQGELLAAAEAGAPGDRLAHRVYGAHRAHIRALLLEAAPGCDADYLADVLLGALTAELVLHQRRSLEMTAERLKGGWISLVDGVLSSARALAGR
ncbi:MAG: TetR/AcrR family transcriptional regulator [Actinobacteria bacterium]|nr:MAG: TetR/AcrR family transcriptional regulator [Actinomycetota bacterium]